MLPGCLAGRRITLVNRLFIQGFIPAVCWFIQAISGFFDNSKEGPPRSLHPWLPDSTGIPSTCLTCDTRYDYKRTASLQRLWFSCSAGAGEYLRDRAIRKRERAADSHARSSVGCNRWFARILPRTRGALKSLRIDQSSGTSDLNRRATLRRYARVPGAWPFG